MPDPTPEHLLLLREILRTGNDQASAILEIANSMRHLESTVARMLLDHETASGRRHDAIQRVADALDRAQTAREDALARAEAEAVARVTTANASAAANRAETADVWWRIAKIAGFVVLPIALGLASHYAPDAVAGAVPAVEVAP